MQLERVPTGIKGLDPLIGGGFPKGSLIVLAGNPGTGKTIFSAQFLYRGVVEYSEKGIYVSFAESRETFYGNMKSYGWDFEDLEKKGDFKFLDVVTGREELLPTILERIVDEVHKMTAKRLVIDSFSAMAQAFEKPIDARIIIHTVLSKITRHEGCTALMIEEVPFGEEKIGLGMEEFVADGVLLLERRIFDGMLLREITILKLRGTEFANPTLPFTLKGGFQVFKPLPPGRIEWPTGKFEVIPHEKDYLSTGVRQLDRIVKGLFTTGSYDLIEVENDVAYPLEYLVAPIMINFLNQNYGVAIIPPQGISAKVIKDVLEPYVDDEILQSNLKVSEYVIEGDCQPEGHHVIPMKGKSIEEDMERFWRAVSQLRERTSKPVLTFVGFDTIEYMYGVDEALKILGRDVARVRNFRDIRLNIVRPSIGIADQLRAIAQTYMKVAQIDGAVFLYGIKPKTPLFHAQLITEKGVHRIELTPIV